MTQSRHSGGDAHLVLHYPVAPYITINGTYYLELLPGKVQPVLSWKQPELL